MLITLAQLLDKNAVNLPKPNASSDKITSVLNLVFVSMGALALLMLVIAGFRYTISQGDPNSISSAKRMIVYTIIGLVVISLAATVVNFVLGKVK